MLRHSPSRWARRSITTVAAAAAAIMVLSACTAPAQTEPAQADRAVVGTDAVQTSDDVMLADHGLSGLDAREIIDYLDALPTAKRPDDLMVSIRPNELVISDAAQREVILPMPDDQFYVSIAPYENRTHDCYFHSLTTCAGELENADMHMLVTDAGSGEVLVDESRSTFDNGFVGVWLPRDIDVTVTIEYDGLSATADLSTKNDDDATCVTTMKLS